MSGVEIVRLRGEIDFHFIGELDAALWVAVEESNLRLVVDLTDVSSFDSSALGTILGMRRRLLNMGGALVVVAESPEAVRVFKLTGVDRLVQVVATIEQGIALALA